MNGMKTSKCLAVAPLAQIWHFELPVRTLASWPPLDEHRNCDILLYCDTPLSLKHSSEIFEGNSMSECNISKKRNEKQITLSFYIVAKCNICQTWLKITLKHSSENANKVSGCLWLIKMDNRWKSRFLMVLLSCKTILWNDHVRLIMWFYWSIPYYCQLKSDRVTLKAKWDIYIVVLRTVSISLFFRLHALAAT